MEYTVTPHAFLQVMDPAPPASSPGTVGSPNSAASLLAATGGQSLAPAHVHTPLFYQKPRPPYQFPERRPSNAAYRKAVYHRFEAFTEEVE